MRHRLLRAAAGAVLVAALALVGAATASAAVYLTPDEAAEQLLPPHDEMRKEIVVLDEGQQAWLEQELGAEPDRSYYVWRVALRKGDVVGYMLIDNELGKHEPITFAVALDERGAVHNLAVCVYREPRGDEIRHGMFMKQFRGKRFGDRVRLDREIVHVSGATISSRSAVTVVRRTLALWQLQFGADSAPPGQP